MKIGAVYSNGEGAEFVVWAPFSKKVYLKLLHSVKKNIPMAMDSSGYWRVKVNEAFAGMDYFYSLDGMRDRSDPASGFQASGVHGPSRVVDHDSFNWEDGGWTQRGISEMIIYELHVGTFTQEGTFEGVISKLDELIGLGVNAVELMPVAQFPGNRNWGYDGVYPFAVQDSYGGPEGLKRLVNECHKKGIAVILDVVYNHLGPEGNYLWDFGPYFTDKYKTPWGNAVNFDGAYNNEVRNFFMENAVHWFENYHMDALRLDAVHAIYDLSAKTFLEEFAESIEEYSKKKGKKFYIIAESDLNDPRLIRPRDLGGFNLSAQWCDDFHHSLYALLTGEKNGYYADFGETGHLLKSFEEGFVYSGQFSTFRKKNFGSSSKDVPPSRFIVFSQNHDQVGNRMLGERLAALISFEALKLAAATVLFSPYVPLLFMGEEYGEENPFLYFVSHSDSGLIDAVRKGRREEFKSFNEKGRAPDPQSEDTFLKSKLSRQKKSSASNKILFDFYKQLISLRKNIPALCCLEKNNIEVFGYAEKKVVIVKRRKDDSRVFFILNFNKAAVKIKSVEFENSARKVLDSSDKIWSGPGSLLPERIAGLQELDLRPCSAALYKQEV